MGRIGSRKPDLDLDPVASTNLQRLLDKPWHPVAEDNLGLIKQAIQVGDLQPCPFCGGGRLEITKSPRFGPDTPEDEPEG
jgi:hypothetical protein